ncbi:LacI family DNA-binding transcriptional regulator [Actinokineospora sp. 24-640]
MGHEGVDPPARATIEDVAKAAGVSRQTVSRALNDMAEISAQTRARVLDAAAALGYRPNMFARGMKTRKSDMIGLIVSDIANPFYPSVARGVFDAAREHGWNVVLYNTDADRGRERAALVDLVDRGAQGAVGFFYATPEADLVGYTSALPLVVADRTLRDPALSVVSADFAGGTATAVEHLVARGHRAIGMLDSSVGLAVDERREAFVAAMARHGLDPDGAVVVGSPDVAGGAAATRSLLAARPTTAIFGFNDLMALGAVRTLRELGLGVPEDCAVIGFDDLEFSQYADPPLTTVHSDKHEHGALLVRVLAELREQPRSPIRISMPVRLVERASG